jgi:hypothetical protein
LESSYDSTLLQSPLIGAIEDLSPQTSPIISRHSLSKDETINDPLTSSLFSPQQGTFSISSPITPFSIPSGPSPITPIPLSPSSSFTQSILPSNNNSIIHDINSIKPSSSSSSSSSSSTATNTNVLSTEKNSKKSTFNRSLPHSLVS